MQVFPSNVKITKENISYYSYVHHWASVQLYIFQLFPPGLQHVLPGISLAL